MSTGDGTDRKVTFRGIDFESLDVRQFLDNVQTLIVDDVLVRSTRRENKVINFRDPVELQELLDLTISPDGAKHDTLVEACKNVIEYSAKTGHPRFFNQLYSGLNAYGLAGSWLADSLNTNGYTFEASPVFVIMELSLLQKICGILGYENGDGVFCPGGSFSNIMAMHLARYKVAPEAHYSLVKGAMFLGMGLDSVVRVTTDERGKMKPEVLEARIQEDLKMGHLPAMVMATAGTTVLGAYDLLEALADVCDRYGVWLHCDACWGGGALLSNKHRHLMAAVHRTHSLAWNFHKMSGAPLQSAAFLVNEKGLMEECNQFKAEYLFQPDKFYDTSYDIGDKTVQCGRKVDSLKLWLLWKAVGDAGMAAVVDNCFENAQYLAEKMKQTDGFRLVIPEFECANVCFWYIPESLRGQEETPEWWQKISKVGPAIKERMVREGSMMMGFTPLTCKGHVNFFRMILANAKSDRTDMDFVVSEIDRLGKDL
ncbi:hypothetical protein DPMN_080191 [Dreissena polymorpha]|uniref:Cysteine sulfinic acid decarboxylase n=1 Tax=Dreissena polymorpha TaxID=45954 RepID=A0A9D3YS63_DREPO|nr:hypothetical protein DPMN_080191 [Dreissena polymorpha]